MPGGEQDCAPEVAEGIAGFATRRVPTAGALAMHPRLAAATQ